MSLLQQPFLEGKNKREDREKERERERGKRRKRYTRGGGGGGGLAAKTSGWRDGAGAGRFRSISFWGRPHPPPWTEPSATVEQHRKPSFTLLCTRKRPTWKTYNKKVRCVCVCVSFDFCLTAAGTCLTCTSIKESINRSC